MTETKRKNADYSASAVNLCNPENCPNRHLHISAYSGYGRTLCLVCQKVYVISDFKKKENNP